MFLVFSAKRSFWFERNRLAANSNLRRTCNTRIRRRPACTFSTPAAASTPGNTGTDLPAILLLGLRQLRSLTPQQLHPTIPGRSPAFRPVSRPHGYSIPRHRGESARDPGGWPARHKWPCSESRCGTTRIGLLSAVLGPRLPSCWNRFVRRTSCDCQEIWAPACC